MSAECSIIERQINSQNSSKLSKLVQISKLGLFLVYGVGPVFECGLVYCLI